MKVMNIGIIIRNDHDHTFPVALTQQMVQIIQNLLVQIPMMQQNIVGPDGMKPKIQQSIPIIPRKVDFDWEEAYKPMLPDDEKVLMEALQKEYTEAEEAQQEERDPDKKILELPRKKQTGEDPLNPFNLELDASGRANVNTNELEAQDIDKKPSNPHPDPLEGKEVERRDETVTPDALGLSGGQQSPGS